MAGLCEVNAVKGKADAPLCRVRKGDLLATCYSADAAKAKAAAKAVDDAILIGKEKPAEQVLIKRTIGA